MTSEILIKFGKDQTIGNVSGVWTSSYQSKNRFEKWNVRSVGYSIAAASVSKELGTDELTVFVKAAGPQKALKFAKSLPTRSELVSTVNQAISGAYYSFQGGLPRLVGKPTGWVWENPTSDDFVITFSNENQQQLWLGEHTDAALHTITVPANSQSGYFIPDPRLGAVSQSLVLHPGANYRLELPLSGGYGSGILFMPNNAIIELAEPVNTAEIRVFFPSISAQMQAKTESVNYLRIVVSKNI